MTLQQRSSDNHRLAVLCQSTTCSIVPERAQSLPRSRDRITCSEQLCLERDCATDMFVDCLRIVQAIPESDGLAALRCLNGHKLMSHSPGLKKIDSEFGSSLWHHLYLSALYLDTRCAHQICESCGNTSCPDIYNPHSLISHQNLCFRTLG